MPGVSTTSANLCRQLMPSVSARARETWQLHLLLMDDLGHCVQAAYGGSLKSIAVSSSIVAVVLSQAAVVKNLVY
jgi:hypothetical protein